MIILNIIKYVPKKNHNDICLVYGFNHKTYIKHSKWYNEVFLLFFNFSSFILPLTKRMFPALLAQQIVSVQPMSMPAGQIFYMDFGRKSNRDRKRYR